MIATSATSQSRKKNTGPTIPPKAKEELPKVGQSVFWREKEEKKRKKKGVIVNTNKVWPFFNGED
jgi:hypothetical protein